MLKAILIFIVVLLAIAGLAWGSMKALDRFSPGKSGQQGTPPRLPKREEKDSDSD